MVKALLDTNILIDYLNGISHAKAEIGRYRDKAISVVTWMEVMVGTTPGTVGGTRAFLRGFRLLTITENVAEIAVELRQSRKIKLPDAIVWATARSDNRLLVTRNTKDFPAHEPGVRLPYGT